MYMLHHESHGPAHVALRITFVANLQRKSSSFLVTILKKPATLPPPLQQYQWLRPTKWPRRAKITEKKLEVGLVQKRFQDCRRTRTPKIAGRSLRCSIFILILSSDAISRQV